MSAIQSAGPSADFTGQPPAPASRDPFAKLAKWYDVLHSSKDYDGDARLYAKHLGAKPGDTVIEWGCGTGEFTRRFAGFGWKMIGVDASEEMLAVAAQKEVPEWAFKPSLIRESIVGAICNERAVSVGDRACAPFAVISYAGINNTDLLASFRRIRKHLHRSGRFVFDVIHAAAAAAELRADEKKIGERDGIRVQEYRRKIFRPADCIVDIMAEGEVIDGGGTIIDRFGETHLMRAFSPPELHLALSQCGFRVLDIFAPWRDAPADEGTAIQVGDYYLMVVAEAV